ncbi:MAG TPA: RDD family protein [Phycisphaerae bacterium]|nr:RDD family protein [Phycisphaerae bacterium]HNU44531.1 RDD family protein [Phycisphaerae bacterium]
MTMPPTPTTLHPPCCPICLGTKWRTRKHLLLYGVRVCRKCYYSLANRRQAAFILDNLCFSLAVGMTLGLLSLVLPPALADAEVFWQVAFNLMIVAFGFKDGFGGYSPFKWLAGVQVVDVDTLEPITFGRSFLRNLPVVGIMLVQSVCYNLAGLVPWLMLVVAMASILLLYIAMRLCRGPRWGDGVARTKVVWKKYAHRLPFDTRGHICVNCGYDLRGNVSGVCPECGRPIAAAAIAPPVVPPVLDSREEGLGRAL